MKTTLNLLKILQKENPNIRKHSNKTRAFNSGLER